jgi:hypothetical protein
MRWALVVPAAVIGLVVGCRASAEPQANAGLTVGMAGTSQRDGWWSETRVHLGLHGDVLFGRRSNRDFGLGPYVEGLTSFGDVQAGGGVSGLLPVHSYLPLVLSMGGYGRRTDEYGWEPGVDGQLFWGSRSFNYASPYVMAGGLRLEWRLGLGDSRERSIVVAAHVDGEVVMLPVLLAYEWIRGSRE